MTERRLVSLDWALKRLLRSKANFVVLEGFLSELLHEDIKILAVLESESNQEDAQNKYNQVDLKVRNHKDEIILIEVQFNTEYDYFHRILFATSKTIVDHLDKGDQYDKTIKVISVNILYFNLGHGMDYIYTGSTNFIGLHHKDQLQLSAKQQKLFKKATPADIFPEYYLINVSKFDDVARTTLDEWIHFLKYETIEENFTAKGLQEAKEILDIMKLNKGQREAYEAHIANMRSQRSAIDSAKFDGLEEGRKEGRKEEKYIIARSMLADALPMETIAKHTGLGREELLKLKNSK